MRVRGYTQYGERAQKNQPTTTYGSVVVRYGPKRAIDSFISLRNLYYHPRGILGHGPRRSAGAQGGTTAGIRCAAPAPGASPRPSVSLGSILRCARHRSGSIRDGSPGSGREATGTEHGPGLRSDASHPLRGPGSAPGQGFAGTAASRLGSSGSSQAPRCRAGVRAGSARSGTLGLARRAGPSIARTTGTRRPPQHDLACPAADGEKKPCGPRSIAVPPSAEELTRRYEEMRGLVLAQGRPGIRWGLPVLVNEGLSAWMKIQVPLPPVPPLPPPEVRASFCEAPEELIVALASFLQRQPGEGA